MEFFRALWFISFCLFALTLIFTWSKIIVIRGRVRSLEKLLNEIIAVGGDMEEENAASKP